MYNGFIRFQEWHGKTKQKREAKEKEKELKEARLLEALETVAANIPKAEKITHRRNDLAIEMP